MPSISSRKVGKYLVERPAAEVTLMNIAFHFDIRFPPESPDDFVWSIAGDVLLYDSSTDNPLKVGTISAHYIDLTSWAAFSEDYPSYTAFDVFDAHSAELSEVYTYVMNKSGCLKRRLCSSLAQDIRYLDRVTVDAERRGQGIGSQIVPFFIRSAGRRAAITVVRPWPFELNPDRNATAPPDASLVGSGVRRLRRFYRRIGFRPLGRGPFMYHDSAWPLHLPDGREL